MLTPLTALAPTEFILKPLVHRTNIVPPGVRRLAYPSGHETALSSALVILGLLALRSRRPLSVALSVCIVTVLVIARGIDAASGAFTRQGRRQLERDQLVS